MYREIACHVRHTKNSRGHAMVLGAATMLHTDKLCHLFFRDYAPNRSPFFFPVTDFGKQFKNCPNIPLWRDADLCRSLGNRAHAPLGPPVCHLPVDRRQRKGRQLPEFGGWTRPFSYKASVLCPLPSPATRGRMFPLIWGSMVPFDLSGAPTVGAHEATPEPRTGKVSRPRPKALRRSEDSQARIIQ